MSPHAAIGLAVSLLCHAGVLAAGGRLLAQSAEYGIETGSGGLQVELIAALPAGVPGGPSTAPRLEAAPEPEPEIPASAVSLPTPEPPAPPASAHAAGDGSSALPGADATTFRSSGGGRTDAAPNYLRNPVPPYPLEARRAGAEGTVLLRVVIDAAGRTEQVELIQSSGAGSLDASAVATVRRWRFRPARVGGIAVSSVVEIPIRFVLESVR